MEYVLEQPDAKSILNPASQALGVYEVFGN